MEEEKYCWYAGQGRFWPSEFLIKFMEYFFCCDFYFQAWIDGI